MKQELQEELFAKYPKLFRQKDLPKSESCLAFGIECGDGWYSLIDELSQELTDKYDNMIEYAQIKAKFGIFTVHVARLVGTPSFSVFLEVISKYETRSATMCERCGKEAIRKSVNGWIHTLCDVHMTEVENRFKDIEDDYVNIFGEPLE